MVVVVLPVGVEVRVTTHHQHTMVGAQLTPRRHTLALVPTQKWKASCASVSLHCVLRRMDQLFHRRLEQVGRASTKCQLWYMVILQRQTI